MKIGVYWRDDACLYWTFPPQWTWNEFERALARAHTLITGVTRPVGMIFDLPSNALLPADFLMRTHEYNKLVLRSAHTLVVVGRSAYVQGLMMIAQANYDNSRVLLARTTAEADALLNQRVTGV